MNHSVSTSICDNDPWSGQAAGASTNVRLWVVCGARAQAVKVTLIACKQGEDFLYNTCYGNMIRTTSTLTTINSVNLIRPIATGREVYRLSNATMKCPVHQPAHVHTTTCEQGRRDG